MTGRDRGDELLALAEKAVRRAGGECLATVTEERALFARFARSAPTQATRIERVSLEVLCVRNGHTGSALGTAADDDAIAGIVGAAKQAAESAQGTGDYPGLPDPAPTAAHHGHDPATAALDPSDAGGALRTILDIAAEQRVRAAGLWTAGEVTTALASSTGMRAVDAVTDGFVKVVARAESGRSGYAADTGVSIRELDPAAVTRRAATLATVEGEEVRVDPGEYPVVLAPAAVAELLEFLGVLAFNGQADAEGRSALSGRLGTPVAAPHIQLSDTTRSASTLPRAFDAEGVPKTPISLIADGVARNVVHDVRSAAIAGDGARSTGHALAPGGAPGGPAPTNLVLNGGGAADENELAAPIERGDLYLSPMVREPGAFRTYAPHGDDEGRDVLDRGWADRATGA